MPDEAVNFKAYPNLFIVTDTKVTLGRLRRVHQGVKPMLGKVTQGIIVPEILWLPRKAKSPIQLRHENIFPVGATVISTTRKRKLKL